MKISLSTYVQLNSWYSGMMKAHDTAMEQTGKLAKSELQSDETKKYFKEYPQRFEKMRAEIKHLLKSLEVDWDS